MNIWGTTKGKFVIVEDIQGKFVFFFFKDNVWKDFLNLGKLTKDARWLLHGMGNEIINSFIICQTSSTFSPKCEVGCTTIEHPNKGEFTPSWGIV
jgi:hypothetical protein